MGTREWTVAAALVCLVAAAVEARRGRSGRASARRWALVFLAGAALCTAWVLLDLAGVGTAGR